MSRCRQISGIPNSIDCQKFSLTKYDNLKKRDELKKTGFNSDAKVVAHVSSLNANKLSSLEGILDAAPKIVEAVPSAQILIVGDGGLFEKVAERANSINQRQGKKLFILLGFVKNDDMPKIIGLVDIVIGVGRVALEAMACKKPVIVAGTSIGPYGGNYGGIVRESNVIELSAHNFSGRNSFEKTTATRMARDCIRLLEDQECMFALGIFGRKYVEQEHDINKTIQKLEGVYQEVIAKWK